MLSEQSMYLQAFADRVSSIFVPIVVALAFFTWLAW